MTPSEKNIVKSLVAVAWADGKVAAFDQSDAKAAQRRIKQAEAEAAQRQYQLDQDFQNRARYINQLDMGRYGQLAAAEATMGLGQGLAQGGEGASAGAAAAAERAR